MKSSSILEKLLLTLPSKNTSLSPKAKYYQDSKKIARREVEGLFNTIVGGTVNFKPFGKLTFPYHRMGNVDSLNLFDLDELIIFSFYWANREHYKKVADLGANIGLHSIILEKCGFTVHSYEPDPEHFKILKRNLKLNKCTHVKPFNAAVSTASGRAQFIRVLGNTTGSHLAGAKSNPQGELEKFIIKTESFRPILKWADLIKMDVEGHEKEILLTTSKNDWQNTDAIIEVGNESNAKAIYEHFKNIGVNLFAQNTGWRLIKNPDDMPKSYRDGSLFITIKSLIPWRQYAAR